MNELIRTLISQAEEYAEVRYDRFRNTPLFNACRDTKFAELIVQECCDMVSKRPYVDDGVSIYLHPSTIIKKHFGVE